MRGKLLSVFLMASILLGNLAVADDAPIATPGIEWVKDLETARALSKNDGRPVIAYFTFNACVWCKRLEKACFYDESVVQLSKKFIWVKVNRDNTPTIPKQFNVSAYPSLLTLGEKSENVFRFQSYQEPDEFKTNLRTSLKRFALYKAGKDWMLPPTRPKSIANVGAVAKLNAPTGQVPSGITVLDGSIWLAQGELFQLDANTGRVLAKHKPPKSIADLCSDGKSLYAVTYGWTAGQPIFQIDPSSGKVIREIVTVANKKNRSYGAKGIAWRDGKLYVLEGMRGKVSVLDPSNGKVLHIIQLKSNWLTGLDFRGPNLIAGGRTHVWEFDSKSGQVAAKTAVNYPLRNIAASEDELLLMEQPVFGFGRNHERIQVWPKQTHIYRWRK